MSARRRALAARVRPEPDEPFEPQAGPADAVEEASRPRIAMVAASLELFGGQSVQADVLAQRLRAEGYSVSLVPVNPRFPRPLRWLRRIPYLRTLVNELIYLPSLLGLRKADVVHVYSASYFSFLLGPAPALLAARLMRKRVILNYHSGEADDHLAHWGVLVHPWLRLAHEIVVPSGYLKTVFARYGYDARVISNIADTSNFVFRERPEPAIAPRLLSTRNLEPHYRVETIIRAFALIRLRYPDATLIVAGDGSEAERLKGLTKALKLDAVTFTGSFLPVEASRLYARADCFLNASVIDNQPVSVLEAFASGCAVISTATGDIGAMLEGGKLGALVPPEDPQAIADAVERLMDNPEQRREMIRRAYQSLERFSWPRVRDDWAVVYAAGSKKSSDRAGARPE